MFAGFIRSFSSTRAKMIVLGSAVSIPVLAQASNLAHAESKAEPDHHKILVVGGGTAGITVANQLNKKLAGNEIAIVEPSNNHFYQPLWTMVGAGLLKKEDSKGKTEEYMPKSAYWIKEAVKEFHPDQNAVTLNNGRRVKYDVMIVAAGLQVDWKKVPGLLNALEDQNCPVGSIYHYHYADKTNRILSEVKKGEVLFTQPVGVIKCGGAPQKIMWQWDSAWRDANIRNDINIAFSTPLAGMFAVPKYNEVLVKLTKEREINTLHGTELVQVDGAARTATLRDVKTGQEIIRGFDALHVAPPMSAPDFLKASPLAAPANGFVDVDKGTLQHTRFPNVFAIGDCANLPTSKTAAAVSSQAPVLVHNVMQHLAGKPLTAVYDGYTSCPILVGGGKLILAEFKYGSEIAETFGALVDQSQPSRAAYFLKRYLFPAVYWSSFLSGSWYGPRAWIPPSYPTTAPTPTPVAA